MRFAVLEDDPTQRAYLVRALHEHYPAGFGGFACDEFERGDVMQRVLRQELYDLLILDWNVPGMSGVDLLRWIRSERDPDVPIMLLSSRSSEQDVVQALQAGADDYVVKPIRANEFCARLHRLQHPAGTRMRPGEAPAIELLHGWRFDHAQSRVTPPAGQAQARLTDRQFRLALALFRKMGNHVSRNYLLHCAGQAEDRLSIRSLDASIHRLRAHLHLLRNGLTLQSVYGTGYRLRPSAAAPDDA